MSTVSGRIAEVVQPSNPTVPPGPHFLLSTIVVTFRPSSTAVDTN